ncbi:MAG: bifunctional heptose 7-phosphate kinase/heptose 1-phosphate adenyltransferase, partial [Gemmatimonadota bacterium]
MSNPFPATELRDSLIRFRPGRVLVYGDILLDDYLFGRADRLSPEKPVPVVAYERRERMLGGAGNVARNLHALGCEPVLVGFLGDDDAGRECQAQLRASGLTTDGLVVEPGRSTPRKLRVHAGQHALLRIDYEDPEGATQRGYAALRAALARLAPGCDAAIISDYRKGAVTAEGVAALRAAIGDAPLVADPKGGDAGRYRGATHLLPNERELADLLGGAWDDAGAEALRERLALEALVLTRSERGLRLYDGGPPRDIPARARQVFDVTGAGDTFAAVFTAALAAGRSTELAARLANVAAGIVVGKVGTGIVTRAELEADVARPLTAPS